MTLVTSIYDFLTSLRFLLIYPSAMNFLSCYDPLSLDPSSMILRFALINDDDLVI